MNEREQVASGLATALLAGAWTRPALRSRVRAALGRPRAPKWSDDLVDQVLAVYREAPVDRPRELMAVLQAGDPWARAWASRRPPRIVQWTPVPTRVVERPWPVAELPDLAALARLLDLDVHDPAGELAWFADVRSWERRSAPALQHYRWTVRPRPHGLRLVAAPKPRLKEIQRRLLRHVLEPIAVHPAAHGGVRGRSVRTAAAPHTGATVVLRVDLEGFFGSIPAGRVWSLLRLAGLPEPVAHAVTGLVTTVVPFDVLREVGTRLDDATRARLSTPHLPTGAPTSPALANLVAFALDRRLDALAARFGARYTRYVDDLTFSGGPSLRKARARFLGLVDTIVRDEGFRVNERKTVILGDAGRQALLGVIVNERVTLPRPERDELRAILHNCAAHGWRTQVREHSDLRAHLLGRISWAAGVDPVFGAELRRRFDLLDWT